MAPRTLADDFVLTISDDEDNIPDLDGEPDQDLPAAPNKKRKRNSTQPDDDLSASKKKSKKSKKQKKAPSPSPEPDHDDEEENWAAAGEDDGAMDSDFEFQAGDVDIGVIDDFDGWGLESDAKKKGGDKKAVDIDEIIARRRQKQEGADEQNKKAGAEDSDSDADLSADEEFTGLDEDETLAEDGFGMGAQDAEESGDEEDEGEDESEADEDESEEEEDDDDEEVAKPVSHPDDLQSDSSDDEEREDPVEAERRKAFFAPEENLDGSNPPVAKGKGSFQHMSLSRPILKGVAAVGFTEPTPIQAKTIPVALLGKDVVGGAVTGSGKTGAFIIPILERLLYRPKKVATTRVAILMPTRELAVQCFNVAKKLAAFTDITFAQIVGGFSLREQENTLKQRPDVVIATPGRFIDHMRNSPSFAVDTLEILVLDEADRMLEDGFADELNEILTTIPPSRQTMLFSATMTDSVDKLIRVGLNKPVRLMVDAKKTTVSGLVQEFVRLRPGKEEKKLAVLMYLCEKVYTDRVIIFFRQKKEAHRVRILFGLNGIKAAELHGSMSQEQRISAVESFRSHAASHLLATDLASRGLDIKGVTTVINYGAPQSHEIYLHRVGRTARGGATGRACTIATEPDRKVVKAVVKAARTQQAADSSSKIVSRQVPPAELDRWDARLRDADDDIDAILADEKAERALSQADMEIRKGENIVRHQDEILARPKRTWFETEQQKLEARKAGRAELNNSGEPGVKKEKKKLSNKEKKSLDAARERKEGAGSSGMGWKKGKAERAGKGALEPPKKKKKTSSKTPARGPKKGAAAGGGPRRGGARR
ncbi:atp-dependent rna helicase drs1 [Diplodia corticola]|uniref:RNA helicase n=1 Tax=Diplodia corticola TaxID=236234 RepID=A0A1J9RT83_9PEZI|nr:atp-dependent rna helicase drs1 [Diplodia corticola]OJD30741.1 atp-dependent rna helicase drs1 [Diplodia corticola]